MRRPPTQPTAPNARSRVPDTTTAASPQPGSSSIASTAPDERTRTRSSAPVPTHSGSVAGRAAESGLGMFGAVFLVGAAGACCGGVPIGLVLGAAGAAGVLTGLGVLGLAIVPATGVALVALLRSRAPARACRQTADAPESERISGVTSRAGGSTGARANPQPLQSCRTDVDRGRTPPVKEPR